MTNQPLVNQSFVSATSLHLSLKVDLEFHHRAQSIPKCYCTCLCMLLIFSVLALFFVLLFFVLYFYCAIFCRSALLVKWYWIYFDSRLDLAPRKVINIVLTSLTEYSCGWRCGLLLFVQSPRDLQLLFEEVFPFMESKEYKIWNGVFVNAMVLLFSVDKCLLRWPRESQNTLVKYQRGIYVWFRRIRTCGPSELGISVKPYKILGFEKRLLFSMVGNSSPLQLSFSWTF
jgi:hypothetical protein